MNGPATDSLGQVAIELAKLLGPLQQELMSSRVKGFFAQLGITLTDAQAAALAGPLNSTVTATGQLVELVPEIIDALDAEDWGTAVGKGLLATVAVGEVISGIDGTATAAQGQSVPDASHIAERMFNFLLARYLDRAQGLNGVIRRMVVGSKVDGGIAAIDVSSWCNCCGSQSTNEIDGLSVGGRPPRNTIVGDEPAVSGMTVFKVGHATLRTEGRVVDDNYPSFDIDRNGTTYPFTGQIAVVTGSPPHSRDTAPTCESSAKVLHRLAITRPSTTRSRAGSRSCGARGVASSREPWAASSTGDRTAAARTYLLTNKHVLYSGDSGVGEYVYHPTPKDHDLGPIQPGGLYGNYQYPRTLPQRRCTSSTPRSPHRP